MIDVSNNNGHVDWRKVRSAGHRIAAIKASESSIEFRGDFYDDAYFHYNMQAAIANRIIACPYYFAHPTWDAREQARHFLTRAHPYLKDRYCGKFALDIEQANGISDTELVRWCLEFSQVLHSVLRYLPIIYSYTGFVGKFGHSLVNHPLWIANYTYDPRKLPSNSIGEWKRKNLYAHQYSDRGSCAGIAGAVDLSHRLTPLHRFKNRRFV